MRQQDTLSYITSVLGGMFQIALSFLLLIHQTPINQRFEDLTGLPIELLAGCFLGAGIMLWAFPYDDYLFVLATAPFFFYLILVILLAIDGTLQPSAGLISLWGLVSLYLLYGYQRRCIDG
jgi:hypothetical protein